MSELVGFESYVCPYCGVCHTGPCPMVKAIELHPNGTIKRIEYHGREPQLVEVPYRYRPFN